MARTGRPPREFAEIQIDAMVRLFNAGGTTERIGKLHNCSGRTIARVLKSRLGDLRIAKATARARGFMPAGRLGHLPYREGFEAGVRQALTLVKVYGLEAVRRHCNETLLPWRDAGLDDIPPEFIRSS